MVHSCYTKFNQIFIPPYFQAASTHHPTERHHHVPPQPPISLCRIYRRLRTAWNQPPHIRRHVKQIPRQTARPPAGILARIRLLPFRRWLVLANQPRRLRRHPCSMAAWKRAVGRAWLLCDCPLGLGWVVCLGTDLRQQILHHSAFRLYYCWAQPWKND